MRLSLAKHAIAVTGLVWVGCVAVYAIYYVKSRLALPGVEGYEGEWSWQLLFFGLTRLPWLVALLVGVVFLEIRLLKSD